MIRRFVLVGGAIAAVVIVVAALLYYFGGGNQIGQPGQGFFARLRSGFSAITHVTTPQEMAQAPEFAFRHLEIDTTGAQAQACLSFTRNLDVSGKTHYEDYLSIEPNTRIVVRPLDQRLCIAGLAFNQSYSVTLKKGLPDSSGTQLAL